MVCCDAVKPEAKAGAVRGVSRCKEGVPAEGFGKHASGRAGGGGVSVLKRYPWVMVSGRGGKAERGKPHG